VNAIINGKPGLRHQGPGLDAMRAVATAHQHRSLEARPHPNLPVPVAPTAHQHCFLQAPRPVSPPSHTHNPHCHQEFESAIATHAEHLNADPIISHHLSSLYDMLLQENIIRVIEPYSNVETSHF
jgi:26S proteasome regulatory subunit N6